MTIHEHNGAGAKSTGHYYRNRGPSITVSDDSCITCGKALGETLDHFPDQLVDAGHIWSCSIFCERCYRDDCGEEHVCGSPEHLVP